MRANSYFPSVIDQIEKQKAGFSFLRIVVTVPTAQLHDATRLVMDYLDFIGQAQGDYIVVVDGLFMEPDAPWIFGVEE